MPPRYLSGMKIGRPKLKLVMQPEQTSEVRRMYRNTNDTRVKERCQAVLLAHGGQHTHEEIAKVVGRSRSTIQIWLNAFCEEGLASLNTRQGVGGGKPSKMRDQRIQRNLEEGLTEGRWMTGPQVRQWLVQTYGIERSMTSIYYWLGKLGGALKVPRPVHIKKDAAAADDFKAHLYEKLLNLDLPADRRVRVWIQDEARFGLHSVRRRCWGLRGIRVVKPVQQKYEWGYLYGALEVVHGGAQFCLLPSVNLGLTHGFLEQIADSDEDAVHVVMWDQAGFHHAPGDPRIPERIHLLPLPPYSPELSPIEKLWDVVKDNIANRVFTSLDEIEEAITIALRPYWESPQPALSLVGEGWMHTQANAS
jgi:transposase